MQQENPGFMQQKRRDVFPCEAGHAHERSLFGAVLETVQVHDLRMQDRHCCPCACMCEIDRRGAAFITRKHADLPFEPVNGLRAVGRIETGHVAEQRVRNRSGVKSVVSRVR